MTILAFFNCCHIMSMLCMQEIDPFIITRDMVYLNRNA